MKATGTPTADAEMWGDGLEHDDWVTIASVRDWSECSPDEYVRVFPRLLPRQGTLPEALRRHLTLCVAVRGWRLARLTAHSTPPDVALASVSRLDVERLGALHHADFFGRNRLNFLSLLRGGHALAGVDNVDAETRALVFVDSILREIQAGTVRPFDQGEATLFAFCTGIHPAYLWEEALLSHELHTAAGWLGHLHRGRTAVMPTDVAEYFADVIVMDDSGPLVREPHIAPFLASQGVLAEVWRVTRQRLRGQSVVAQWPIAIDRELTGSPLMRRCLERVRKFAR